jgi:hypothetical protein
MTGPGSPSNGSWSPWAPRTGSDPTPRGAAPVSAPPRSSPPPAPPASSPSGPTPSPTPGPAGGSPWSTPGRAGGAHGPGGRAPVTDPWRPAGSPSSPPVQSPPPLLDAPVPGAAPRRRGNALAVFVAFLVGALVVGAAFGVYALGHRAGRGGTTVSEGEASASIGVLDIQKPSSTRLGRRWSPSRPAAENSIFGGSGSAGRDLRRRADPHQRPRDRRERAATSRSGSTTAPAPAELVGAVTADDIALIQADAHRPHRPSCWASANLRVGDPWWPSATP